MSLRQVEGSPADPWEQPLQGLLERLMVRSELLESNRWGILPCGRCMSIVRPRRAVSQ
jgi:hypothetical protein